MISDVEMRLVRARNEVKAQKVATELAYSSILWPENAATANWSGSIALELHDDKVARFRVRFTRTDGVSGTPYVDFAQNVTFSPTYQQYSQSIGCTVTGNDVGYVDDQNYTGYVAKAGSNYVDYYIDFVRDLISNYFSLSSINVTISAQAVAMVSGTLTITRLV